MRLVLGTAQWGLGYGTEHPNSFLSEDSKRSILDSCWSMGIHQLDTASGTDSDAAYGDAEKIIGSVHKKFDITTKVRAKAKPLHEGRFLDILAALQTTKTYACLIHDWHALTREERLNAAVTLGHAKEAGHVGKVGVSAYELSDVVSAAEIFQVLDVVQVPISVVDQRLFRSGALYDLSEHGCEIQVRSIFLQGQLLQPSLSHVYERAVRPFWDLCAERGLSPLEGTLNFIRGITWASRCVIGVNSVDELRQIHDVWSVSHQDMEWESCASLDPEVIDPRKWSS